MLRGDMDGPDHLIRAIDRVANVRIVAVVTTQLAAEAARRHELSAGASCALGRALSSSLLLATLTKGHERVTLQLVGEGPIGSVTADANGNGEVRGYVLHQAAGGSLPPGRPRIVELLGKRGVLNVVRDLGLKELYQGQVPFVSGEVDEDVEAYLRTSEQVPSALGADVVLDDAGRIRAAGGVLVQTMPDGDPEIVRQVQHALRSGRLYELMEGGERSAGAIAQALYPARPIEILGDARPVRFECRCSPERIADTLMLLGTVDLDEMIADSKPTEIVCNFCNTKYQIDRSELERIRAQAAGGPRGSN
jgi:molecular chaperone Hsp33